METKKVLVTGGTGFLGSHLCFKLQKLGYEVISLSRRPGEELNDVGIKQVQIDLSSPNTDLDEVVKSVDVIFHTAGKVGMWGAWEEFYQVNYIGTQNLVDSAKRNGIRHFIYTSTPSVVFDNHDIQGGNEDLPYAKRSKSLYARSKILAEQYVLMNTDDQFKTVALRPHLIFGPGDQNLIPRIIAKAQAGRLRKIGDGKNKVDVIYIDNAVEAHIKAYEALKNNSINVSGKAFFIAQEKPVILWDFIDKVLARYQLPKVQGRIPYFVAYMIASLIEWVFKAFRITKREPPTTRFIVMQLAKSHYFSHKNAKTILGYEPKLNTDEAIKLLGVD
jgi:nucleoside-diphosphate-sugar epimerase